MEINFPNTFRLSLSMLFFELKDVSKYISLAMGDISLFSSLALNLKGVSSEKKLIISLDVNNNFFQYDVIASNATSLHTKEVKKY